MHIHAFTEEELRAGGESFKETARLFGFGEREPLSVDDIVGLMEDAGISKGVIFPSPSVRLDFETINNKYAEIANKYPDKLIAFGTVNPYLGRGAVREIKRAVEDLHLKGLKFHPPAQAFYPNDPMVYPIYETCVEYKIPILIHTGTTWFAFTKIKYAKPEFIDDIACDFRDLVIINDPF